MSFTVHPNDPALTVAEFSELFFSVWNISLDSMKLRETLNKSICITARKNQVLVSCLRVISDGYLASHVCEFMTKDTSDREDIIRALLSAAGNIVETGIVLSVQRVPDKMMRELGWTAGPCAWFRRKTRE